MDGRKQVGEIIKVAGPLVVAKNMLGSKMYDVVYVSDHRLIGEIIELREDRASIQVYEDTTGVGPGEPVYPTGKPLSVELGPGLIGAIFDGIQRPLDKIAEKVGHFITRGIHIDALPRDKKWHFEPVISKKLFTESGVKFEKVKEIKVGDRVEPGDIIGEVQETPLVRHRIMIPPDAKPGTIKKISEGDFTVEEPVAVIQADDGEEYEVKMLQRWPVRVPRPVKKRLFPDIPMVTGQRVVDTFFPIAKGGTACIPGPFGSGKCLTGDTPLLLADGRIVKIGRLYEDFERTTKVIAADGEGGEMIIRNDLPHVVSLKDNGFHVAKPDLLYTTWADRVVEVKTRSGRTVKVTAHHKLRIFSPTLSIIEKEAIFLKPGDWLVTPRKVQFTGDAKIRHLKYLDSEIIDSGEALDSFIDELKKAAENGSLSSIAESLDVSVETLSDYIDGRKKPTARTVKQLVGDKLQVERIHSDSNETKPLKLPSSMTPEFAEWLGFITSSGSVDENSIGFKSLDNTTIERFNALTLKLFDITPEIEVNNGGISARIRESAIAKFIKSFFAAQAIPPHVIAGGDEVVAAFLRGFSRCSAKLNVGRIEFEIEFEELAHELTILLMKLGILYQIERKSDGKSVKLSIPISNLKKFGEIFGIQLNHPVKIEDKQRQVEAVPIASELLTALKAEIGTEILEKHQIRLDDYIKNGEIPIEDLGILLQFKGINPELQERLKHAVELLNSVFLDRIEEVRVIEGPVKVFDFSVPETRNFIAGYGNIVVSNTVAQHQFAKWSDADIVVYIGCGERGNEMTDVLIEFPELKDPRSGLPLMNRTVLIANTSNMPVAAREASVYTGITIAEYFRDMGYSVALMADSTSRWAEAMREISGRLEEMPGEEGYPAYLAARVAMFYERAGRTICLGSDEREGSLTVIGAVSPPGGDLADPVVQATLRVVKVFWSLDAQLAYQRHFPAIHWLRSYSLYIEDIRPYLDRELGEDFYPMVKEAMAILEKENELKEIVRLVGLDYLSQADQLLMEIARSIREDFLHQNAFHEVDTYTSLRKQYEMLKTIFTLYENARKVLEKGKSVAEMRKLGVWERVARMKYIEEDREGKYIEKFKALRKEIENEFENLIASA